MTDISKNLNGRKLDLLSIYQMFGGIIGIVILIYLLFQLDEINVAYIFVLGIGFTLYIFSFAAGLFLFQRKPYGLKFSLLNQLLQVIGFSFWGFGIEYVAGLSFSVFLKYTDSFDFTTTLGLSNWHILINGDGQIREISINLVALFLVFVILKRKRKDNMEKISNEISNLGT